MPVQQPSGSRDDASLTWMAHLEDLRSQPHHRHRGRSGHRFPRQRACFHRRRQAGRRRLRQRQSAALLADASHEFKGALAGMQIAAEDFVAQPSDDLIRLFETGHQVAASSLDTISAAIDAVQRDDMDAVRRKLGELKLNFDALTQESRSSATRPMMESASCSKPQAQRSSTRSAPAWRGCPHPTAPGCSLRCPTCAATRRNTGKARRPRPGRRSTRNFALSGRSFRALPSTAGSRPASTTTWSTRPIWPMEPAV